MYRLFLTALLCLRAASSAPQARESDVTYVKINPVVEEVPAESASNFRESRIEKLPLTIPGNISKSDSKEPDKNPSEENNRFRHSSENKAVSPESKSGLSESNSDVSDNISSLSENLDVSESNQSDTLSEPRGNEEPSKIDDLSETSPTDELSESDTEIVSDTVSSETNQPERRARNFDSIETTETPEDVTEKYEDELIAVAIEGTKAPPKFVPKFPKLSYFQKPRVFQSYSSNDLELASRRKFRSRCTCQKIWNCPKLQITVPRCPDEYFLCCL